MYARIKTWFRNSLTLLIADILSLLSMLLLAVDQLSTILSLPEVQQQLALFLSPKAVAIIGFVSGVVVRLARMRTLPSAGGQ